MPRIKEPHAQDPRKLESGKWQARITYYDPDTGKRHEIGQSFATEREAKKWGREQERKFREDPNLKPPSDKTFGEYMTHWLNDVSKRQVQDTTWADYQLQAKKAVRALGTKPLKSLTALDFQGLYSQFIGEGLSSRTVRYVHTVCRHALQDAVDFGLLPVNPTMKAKAPKLARSTITLPNPDQAQILLREADNHRQRALWYVIALTGMRRGEALGLQWGDIDWSTKTLTVQRNLVEKSHLGIRVHTPKTAHGHRVIALSNFMISILRTHQQLQQAERLAAGNDWQEGFWIFATQRGTWTSPRNAYRSFQRLLARAGLEPMRIHAFRHAMATAWLNQGVPIKVVSERLGHANISITLQIYGHLLPNMQAEAADKMDAWLAGHREADPPKF